MRLQILLFILFLSVSCGNSSGPTANSEREGAEDSGVALAAVDQEFKEYWYAGRAELTTYTLEQARYGELHPGEAVLVFVTEDFLVDSQVKKERPTDENATSVLKLNRIDRFTTGIYDYSTMLSVFTPIDDASRALKTTFSAQDWCGQSWMQTNRRDAGYTIQVRSYFQTEGDMEIETGDVMLEDGLWTLARVDPKALPQGDLLVLPSAQHIRLRHLEVAPQKAKASMVLEVDADGREHYLYTLTYGSGRELRMHIQTSFPHRIMGWEESVTSGFGPGAKTLTTKATFKSSLNEPYWGQNKVSDTDKRRMLGLD